MTMVYAPSGANYRYRTVFVQSRDVVLVFNVSVSGLGFRDFRSCEHPCNASGLRIYQEENNGSDPQETGCRSDRLHQLVFLNCDTAVSMRFLERIVPVSVLSCGHPWFRALSRSDLEAREFILTVGHRHT